MYEKISKEISGYIYGKKIVTNFKLTTQYHFIPMLGNQQISEESNVYIKKESNKEIIDDYTPNRNSFLKELEQSPKFIHGRSQL